MSSNKNALDFVGLDWSAGHPDVFYDRPFDRADVVTDLNNSGSNAVKIDVSGISDSINNYINATKIYDPVPPPPKKPDPDLNGGLAAILGETYEY